MWSNRVRLNLHPSFRNGEVHQGVASLEETLPGKVRVEANAIVQPRT